jgi:hypothetical protein
MGETLSYSPSTSYTEWIRRLLPPRGDRVGLLARYPPPLVASDLLPRQAFSSACCATSGACDARVLAGGDAMVWCSRRALSEVIPGQPLAGRAGTALPCRPDEYMGDSECDFFPF